MRQRKVKISQHFRPWLAAGLAIVVLGLAGWIWRAQAPGSPAKVAVQATPASSPSPPLDPLQIEAIRARTYTASPLTVTQNLGDQGGYTQTVSSYVSDGLTQYALVSTPGGTKPAGGWPVIILAHGYIDPAVYTTAGASYSSWVAELTRAGYLVVKPDYRGHGQSQGQPEGGHFSPAYAYDILNLIASLKIYPQANAGRIGLMGHSLGAHVALRTIVVSPDVKATVMVSGVVGSIDDIINHWPRSPMASDQPAAYLTSKREELFKKYGRPEANPAFWNSVSAINYVAAVKGPVQINHSVGDSVVPVAFSQHLNGALAAAGKPVEYYEYPGDDHQFAANHRLMMQRAIAFYNAHL